MTNTNEICRLEYFYGTLATAYKGIIPSLTAKDFCMIEEGGFVTLKGTIMAMPEGDYDSRLMHEGKELSRSALRNGSFDFKVDAIRIREAKNLQIDVVQKGRHVGTFLLKREKPDEFYTSAIELSDDLRELSPHKLVASLRNRPGLLKRAEEIISIILSLKRDWRRLSEELNSFAKDLYWADRAAFSDWYRVLVQWSARVCDASLKESSGRAAANFLTLAELPLDNSPQPEGSYEIDIWLEVLRSTGVDMASHLHQSVTILKRINERFPGADITPAANELLQSLRDHITNAPVISNTLMERLRSILIDEDLLALENCSEKKRSETMAYLDAAERMIGRHEYADMFRDIKERTALLLDDSGMIERLYAVLERNMNPHSGEILTEVSSAIFQTFPQLSPDALRKAFLNTARFIRIMISLNMIDLCETILNEIDSCSAEIKEGIFLNPELASSVISQGDARLVLHYSAILKQLHVPSPRVTGFSSETWTEIANPGHIERLSKFLAIMGAGKGRFDDILINLLCNLYVSGVFIPDDRLFQRDISAYLNSDAVRHDFLINYMLLKTLPVYFNEVGATNMIRDDTTEIDSWADDVVLYFLRKQIHVNSSNYNIQLVQEIISSWVYNDRSCLKEVVHPDIYNNVNMELLEAYSIAIRTTFISLGVLDESGLNFDKLLALPDSAVESIGGSDNQANEIRRKITLICRIYREIVKKYTLVNRDSITQDTILQLSEDIDRIKTLKKVLLSSETTVPEENLFFKRHIAFGIPSVLGTYHEAKFDALSVILQTENRMAVLFEEIIRESDRLQNDLTNEDFRRWIKCLDIMNELAKVHDMENFQITEVLTVMKSNALHVSQFIDLLRVWQKELTWMVDSVTRRIHATLTEILKSFPRDHAPEYIRRLDTGANDYIDKAADVIIRNMIISIAGFTEMDRFIEVLIKKCRSRIESWPDALLQMSENPDEEPCPDFLVLDELSEQDAMRMAPVIGGKAKNLVYLLNKKLPVPSAVVFQAMKTHDHMQYTADKGFMSVLKRAVEMIEIRTGLKLGDNRRPLLLSIRSGSYISMPGILSSILYCGMNTETQKAFASLTGDSLLSLDSYRRFIDHYATVVLGLDEKIFSKINAEFLRRISQPKLDDLNAAEMAEIVRLYKNELAQRRLVIPEDPYEQLRESVNAVYRSWYDEKAVHFRTAMKISEHWGTAVLLMDMIPGNRKGSGASVFFTCKPSSLEKGVYGDTKETATGDDLVYGKLINRPLAKAQVLQGQRSLEEEDPVLFAMHEELAMEIESAMGGLPQEVEATYVAGPEGKRIIYVLQTRRMEFHRGFIKHFQDICMMESNIIGRGVGVHGGALSGIATFSASPDRIDSIKEETGMPVILLRKSSSTNDVSLMPHIDGIVTSAGGATSHAAILAQKFGLTAVVGCSDMEISIDEKGESFARIGNYPVTEATSVSIDGSTGLVYSGICEFTTETRQ